MLKPASAICEVPPHNSGLLATTTTPQEFCRKRIRPGRDSHRATAQLQSAVRLLPPHERTELACVLPILACPRPGKISAEAPWASRHLGLQ